MQNNYIKIRTVTILLLTISLLVLFAGCSTSYDDKKQVAGGYFTVVKEWGGGTYRIVYANDTKVMYLIVNSGNIYGITPLYNADGTLQIYNSEVE